MASRLAQRTRKRSTLASDSERRWRALMNETSSPRERRTGAGASGDASVEKSSLSAVPRPVTCSLPHKRHLSHPTQSMMRDTFRKCSLNSDLMIWGRNVSGEHRTAEN